MKQKTNFPRSVAHREICLYTHNIHFRVIKKKNQSTFPDATKELEEVFKYDSNENADAISKQVDRYKFSISYEKNCMYAVFAFDLGTCYVENQLHCQPYAAGL